MPEERSTAPASPSDRRSQLHDLRAPLQALALNLLLLRRSLEEDHAPTPEVRREQLRLTDVLRSEIARLDRSLAEFLHTRTPPPAPRRVDLVALARGVARLYRPSARARSVRLITEAPRAPVHVLAHRDGLKRALINLVQNALEAIEAGGTVRLCVAETQDRAVLRVEDDGAGIPPDLVERVFERDFTTKPEGSGLGLADARALIRAEGGHLTLASREGEGTRAEIRFPRIH